ncbi:MAG: PE-PPE domain-containing protein [Mycobacterium sp.]|uniref:PE-PPE domain-containing protein n=1 Tax=Mycobacterium sp. TaxID=1785 RepID=UPI003BB1F484
MAVNERSLYQAASAPRLERHPDDIKSGNRLSAIFGVAVLVSAMVVADMPRGLRASELSLPVNLTAGDVALIMGGSGVPTPTQQYADTAADLYLRPNGFGSTPAIPVNPEPFNGEWSGTNGFAGLFQAIQQAIAGGDMSIHAAADPSLQANGFGGTPEVLTTPELFTNRDLSETQGAADLLRAIQQAIADGKVSADNPLYAFGYSQSSALSGLTMQQLASAGVPADDLHFVLVGDPSAPNGGIYSEFGLTDIAPGTNDLTPDSLYPTDVYTLEYDPVADWPRYSSDLLSDLNAYEGLLYEHLAYLGLTPQQVSDAIPLDTTGDSLTSYYMIPSETLPILDPLLLTPIIGQPLYDLLEPDTSILVNLGYGSITEGWNQGPADVVNTVDWGLPNMDWNQVFAALDTGAQQGWDAFTADLMNPATYQVEPLVDSPALTPLIDAEYGAGLIDTIHPDSIFQVLVGLIGMDSPAALLP